MLCNGWLQKSAIWQQVQLNVKDDDTLNCFSSETFEEICERKPQHEDKRQRNRRAMSQSSSVATVTADQSPPGSGDDRGHSPDQDCEVREEDTAGRGDRRAWTKLLAC